MNANVSVILPTFNRVCSLSAAMTSVLAQSYSDLELIVVDDGSSEDVEGLVRGIRDARVKYIRRHVNGGAAAARNTGLSHAKGKFIGFQDSDDIWLPGKLIRQVALFSTLPGHIGAVTGGKIIYGRDAYFNYGPDKFANALPPEGKLRLDEDQLGHLLRENRISLQSALFRRDCLGEAVWFDTCAHANEDWEFAIRVVQQTTVYEDIEPVVLGFISPDSISSNPRKQTMGMLRILRNNKIVLESRARQRSRLLIDLAVALYKAGKTKRALKFMIAGLRDHPAHIGLVGISALRKACKMAGGRLKVRLPAVSAEAHQLN